MKMCIDFTDFTAKRDVYHNIVTMGFMHGVISGEGLRMLDNFRRS